MKFYFFFIFGFLSFFLAACSDDGKNGGKLSASVQKNAVGTGNEASGTAFYRDWQEITAEGVLRVLVTEDLDESERGLTRRTPPEDYERALLRSFAEHFNLKVEFLEVASFSDLFSLLLSGKGDLVAATLADTGERRKHFALTEPFGFGYEQLVTSVKNTSIHSLDDIGKMTGVIQPGTVYWETMRALIRENPKRKAKALPETMVADDLLEAVGNGKYDYTILDDNFVAAYQAYRDNVKVIHTFSSPRKLVWAVRPESKGLLKVLNTYIDKEAPHKRFRSMTDDLDAIRKRRFIRVLTRNTPYCYFIHRGGEMGFEYELARRFADSMGVAIFPVVPPHWSDLTKWLAEGKGDIVAANYTLTPERERMLKDIRFCAPYSGVTEMLAGRRNETLHSMEGLKGRTVYARRSSSYWNTLVHLRDQGIKFTLLTAPEDMETYELLERVSSGKYDLTVADDTQINLAAAGGANIKALLPLTEHRPYVWLVRAKNPQLKEAVDAFFKKEYRSAFYNLTYKKYYEPKTAASALQTILPEKFKISPYDNLFIKYGDIYSFDWWLLAAQSYQESRFDPAAQSYLGTLGLMQLMPSTAKELGFSDVVTPDNGIHAGTMYLAKQRDKIRNDVDEMNRICFALASYNAGYGHVLDARKLAAELGLNPNVWFDQVEQALTLLSKPKYAAKARFGYCNSAETTAYVRDIVVRSLNYAEQLHKKEREKSKK